MNFNYSGYTQEGAKVSGTVSADDKKFALMTLNSQNITVIEITEIKEQTAGLSVVSKRVSNKELEIFTSQLSTLLKNKLKIDRALELLEKTIPKGTLQNVVSVLLRDVKSGIPLSEALAKTNHFDHVYINLIKVGEASGKLSSVMEGLSKDLSFKAELASKIRQATAYPFMILIFCFVALLFIFNFIVPKMSVMFEDAKNLPFYTEMLLSITDFVIEYQMIGILGFFCMILSCIYLIKNDPKVKEWVNRLMLKIPGLRNIIKELESLKFCSSMNLCVANGVLLEKSLSLSINSVNLELNQKKIESTLVKVKSGESLNRSLSQTDLLDPLQLGILEIGEESGDLASVFAEITSRTRKSFEERVAKLTNLIEPLLIITMGIIVGSIVVTMLMSIISVQDVAL